MSLRDKILNAQNKPIKISVPEWDCDIYVKKCSARDFKILQEAMKDKDNLATEKVVAFCCLDEQGNKIFSEADVEQLSEKEFSIMDRIADICLHENGMKKQAVDNAKKNS